MLESFRVSLSIVRVLGKISVWGRNRIIVASSIMLFLTAGGAAIVTVSAVNNGSINMLSERPDGLSCGPACLWLFCRESARSVSKQDIPCPSELRPDGWTLDDLVVSATKLGYHAEAWRANWRFLQDQFQGESDAAVLHVNGNHFVLVMPGRGDRVKVFDPVGGAWMANRTEFHSRYQWSGVCLLLDA